MKLRAQIGLMLAVGLILGCQEASAQGVIAVTASAKEAKNGHIMLAFDLQNCRHKDVAIYYGELPWHQTFTTLAVFVGVGQFAAEVPGVLVEANYPAHLVHIGPGESKRGVMDLNTFFPYLKKVKNKSELVIFWNYELNDADNGSKRMYGGMVTLRNGSPISSDIGRTRRPGGSRVDWVAKPTALRRSVDPQAFQPSLHSM